MKRPAQIFYLVEGKTVYAFDAVVKSEITTSLKIAEEEGDVKKKKHVNYAILQPDEIQLEVCVSDTVTVSKEPLTKGKGKRSVIAHRTLVAMQKRRNLLTLITPTYTLKHMMIESIAQGFDEEHEVEQFYATVTFKEMIVSKSKKKTTYSEKGKAVATQTSADQSIAYQIFGKVGGSGANSSASGSSAGNNSKPLTRV